MGCEGYWACESSGYSQIKGTLKSQCYVNLLYWLFMFVCLFVYQLASIGLACNEVCEAFF